MISPDLKTFFQLWLNWVATGAPEGQPFSRKEGLCYSLLRWLKNKDQTVVGDPRKELMYLFKDTFGDAVNRKDGSPMWVYPFGGCDRYTNDFRNRTMHKNQKRINWVRKILEERT